MYLNQQTILGFTGRAAEVTQLKNGTAVTKFSVATKVSWKDKEAEEWNEKTQWHNVLVIWNRIGCQPLFLFSSQLAALPVRQTSGFGGTPSLFGNSAK